VIPTMSEEPLANVVFESKRAGVPAIVFPSGGLPETIEHGVDGYICREKSVDALSEALAYYLDRPGEAERQGLAAERSLARFGVHEFADGWIQVYEHARPAARGWRAEMGKA
jgi:glycosyltransferase involved in cell wall biosynthesis